MCSQGQAETWTCRRMGISSKNCSLNPGYCAPQREFLGFSSFFEVGPQFQLIFEHIELDYVLWSNTNNINQSLQVKTHQTVLDRCPPMYLKVWWTCYWVETVFNVCELACIFRLRGCNRSISPTSTERSALSEWSPPLESRQGTIGPGCLSNQRPGFNIIVSLIEMPVCTDDAPLFERTEVVFSLPLSTRFVEIGHLTRTISHRT